MTADIHKKHKVRIYILLIGLPLCCITIPLFITSKFNIFPQLVERQVGTKEKVLFPEMDNKTLSDKQQSIVTILKKEYELNPDGKKYSEGVDEPWCADFVSWTMREAGLPLSNPNSGSWRIPGTYTLREYYESIGTFRSGESNYSPKIGDIVLYDNPSTFGQHTNFVLNNDNGLITTIGGNEPGGIRITTHRASDDPGLVGYGLLKE
jgi:hypothetical protein